MSDQPKKQTFTTVPPRGTRWEDTETGKVMIFDGVRFVHLDAFERRGAWMITYTGRKFWPFDPSSDDVHLPDIAHALANICRYGGHCRKFYSVAQHSVHVSRLVRRVVDGASSRDLQLMALLHDAHEAYIGDIIHPIKCSMSAAAKDQFDVLAEQIQMAIHAGLGVRWPSAHLSHYIHQADMRASCTERRDIIAEHPDVWPIHEGIRPRPEKIVPLPPDMAEELFLERWRELSR